jgi:rare lipoprotein A
MRIIGVKWAAAAALTVIAAAPAIAGGNGHHFSGVAAFYDTHYSGRTASGERYNAGRLTAAHRSLPFGTHLRITDRRTRRTVDVVVNDRGPFTRGRVLDLSLAAARQLQMIKRGLARVDAEVVH